MNSQISFVAIVLTLCLSNIHSSTGDSKGNDTLGLKGLKWVNQVLKEKGGRAYLNKTMQHWRLMKQNKSTTNPASGRTVPSQETGTKASSAKPTASTSKSMTNYHGIETPTKPSTGEPTTPTSKPTTTKHRTEIPTKLSTEKPTIQTRKSKSVTGTPTKPSTKNSKQKSPTSKTITATNVAGTPNKSSTGKPTTSSSKPTTSKSVTGTPSNSSTKTPTFQETSPASKPMTAKNVTGTPSNSSTDEGTLPSNNTTQSERTSDWQLFRGRSTFPVFFMVILVVVVAVYFTYHNRNKIHKFIKGGFSNSTHGGTGYLKVKLEDGIDLPHEANRNYIY